MRIFKEACGARARAGLLCLLATFGAARIGAADLASPKGVAQSPWRVALALFYKVDAATLADTAAQGFSIDDARRAAASSSAAYNALSSTFPGLIQRALTPLPDRQAAPGKAGSTAFADFRGAAANAKAAAAPYIDLAERESLTTSENTPSAQAAQANMSAGNSGWEGLVCGFYTLAGETLDCRALLFEAGTTTAVRVLSWRGEIGSLDRFAAALLPEIASWIAGQSLGIIDISPQPERGAPLSLAVESGTGRGYLKGSRLYVAAEGDFKLRAERVGFDSRTIEALDIRLGAYRKESVALEPSAPLLAAESLANAGSLLNWKESEAFRRTETRYRSALGRFVASVPLTAIALGVFFSYSEAYARGAVSDAAYYASGAGAAAAAGLSLGFLIDCAVGLVNVINASK